MRLKIKRKVKDEEDGKLLSRWTPPSIIENSPNWSLD